MRGSDLKLLAKKVKILLVKYLTNRDATSWNKEDFCGYKSFSNL
jgi:hypothetical protein